MKGKFLPLKKILLFNIYYLFYSNSLIELFVHFRFRTWITTWNRNSCSWNKTTQLIGTIQSQSSYEFSREWGVDMGGETV